MAINNDIGRDGSPSRPNPGLDGAFGEHALPITWIDKMKENPMKQSKVADWPRVPTRVWPLRPGYCGVAVKENVMSEVKIPFRRYDTGAKI